VIEDAGAGADCAGHAVLADSDRDGVPTRGHAVHRGPRAMAATFDGPLARSSDHVDCLIGSAGPREGVASQARRRPRLAPLGPD
jgi:hypothetical protein